MVGSVVGHVCCFNSPVIDALDEDNRVLGWFCGVEDCLEWRDNMDLKPRMRTRHE